MKIRRMVAVLSGLTLAACGAEQSTEGLVARAGDHELTVDEAVELLLDQENLPNDVQVVGALADLWIDYTLLASQVARDSTLRALDLEPLIRQQLNQEMIFQLRDSVIQPDTAITEEALRQAYEQEAPDAQLRASHILMGYPPSATQAQRDSVQALMQSVRGRAAGGESFEALARQYSQDPATAGQGGDLGTFSRGEMVKPFEDAAFALQPGEISQVVETPYGLHVIRLEEKTAPGFDQVRDQFRVRMLNQRFLQAESVYVAGIQERGNPQITEGAAGVVKQLASDPATRLQGRAANRALVEYEGGSVTVREFLTLLQGQQPQFREQVGNATDEQISNFLMGLAQRELLVAEAARAGLEPSPARVDSLVGEARAELLGVVTEMGLRNLEPAPGEGTGPAVDRAVEQALRDVLAGAKDVVPLGPLAFQLRQRQPTAVYEAGLGEVVLKVGQTRAARSPAPADTLSRPDTTGN